LPSAGTATCYCSSGWPQRRPSTEASTLVFLTVIGLGNALVDIGLFTVMARLTSDDVMARVFGLLESVIALSVGTGAILTPVAIDLLGLRPALVVVGLLGPALVALAWRRLRHLDTSLVGRDREIGQLRAVAMFRPLPLPVVDQLARGLELSSIAGGSTVFAQGDEGDRFYLIEAGSAEVLGDGKPVATLGPGDVFGEIALLRRVPRTAHRPGPHRPAAAVAHRRPLPDRGDRCAGQRPPGLGPGRCSPRPVLAGPE